MSPVPVTSSPSPSKRTAARGAAIETDATAITSPLRRMPSFIEDEDAPDTRDRLAVPSHSPKATQRRVAAENDRGGGLNTVAHKRAGSPATTSPVRKRSTPLRVDEETELRSQSLHAPSWTMRLQAMRLLLARHRSRQNRAAWWRDLYRLGEQLVLRQGSECARTLLDLLVEYRDQWTKDATNDANDVNDVNYTTPSSIIPVSCGNVHLDKLQVQALTLLGRFDEALEVATQTLATAQTFATATATVVDSDDMNEDGPVPGTSRILSDVRFLQAQLYRALGNLPRAVEAFQTVLKEDPGHLDAREHLYGATCGLLPRQPSETSNSHDMQDPRDALHDAFLQGDYLRVVLRTERTLSTEWLGDEGATLWLAGAWACLHNASALYRLAQRLVQERPLATVTWYVVGLFYQASGRGDDARRYFFKAGSGVRTEMRLALPGPPDPSLAPAWIALGHSFAAQGDHDQAVSAYTTAIRTHSPGATDPALFLAMEYLRVRQPLLAAAYLLDVGATATGDARVLNELAVLHVHKNDWDAARRLATRAVANCQGAPRGEQVRIVVHLNAAVIALRGLREADSLTEVRRVLEECGEGLLRPLLATAQRQLADGDRSRSAWSLFPWSRNAAHPSPHALLIFVFAATQEWRAAVETASSERAQGFAETARQAYRQLLDCRNEHRWIAGEPLVMERMRRVLVASAALSNGVGEEAEARVGEEIVNGPLHDVETSGCTPHTPLIRSHSTVAAASASSVESLAASVSRRRLSLRRQMTGLRFDLADASFSSLDSDNVGSSVNSSFLTGHRRDSFLTVSANQLTMELMSSLSSSANQSMMLIDGEEESDHETSM